MKAITIVLLIFLFSISGFSQFEFGGIAGNSFAKENGLPFIGVTVGGKVLKGIGLEFETIYFARPLQPLGIFQSSGKIKLYPTKIINLNLGFFGLSKFKKSAIAEIPTNSKSGIFFGVEADFKTNCKTGLRLTSPGIELIDSLYSKNHIYFLQLYVGYTFRKN